MCIRKVNNESKTFLICSCPSYPGLSKLNRWGILSAFGLHRGFLIFHDDPQEAGYNLFDFFSFFFLFPQDISQHDIANPCMKNGKRMPLFFQHLPLPHIVVCGEIWSFVYRCHPQKQQQQQQQQHVTCQQPFVIFVIILKKYLPQKWRKCDGPSHNKYLKLSWWHLNHLFLQTRALSP